MSSTTVHHSWVWQDGERLHRDEFQLDPFDHGLLYGLGAFETTRTFDGVPWLWESHLKRMALACKILGISSTSLAIPTADQVRDFVRSLGEADVVVRWSVTGGSGERAGCSWIITRALPESTESCRLVTSSHRISTRDPFANHKTLNYGVRRLAFEESSRLGANDALLLDHEENVLETSTSNLFVRHSRGWATPALSGGVLAGTVRELLLSHGEPPSIQASVLPFSALADAREVFVTNSVRGVTPVTAIDDHRFPVGEETLRIREWILEQRP
ncbi:MAG: aminotransferase class IV [Planctomycetota bacterium]